MPKALRSSEKRRGDSERDGNGLKILTLMTIVVVTHADELAKNVSRHHDSSYPLFHQVRAKEAHWHYFVWVFQAVSDLTLSPVFRVWGLIDASVTEPATRPLKASRAGLKHWSMPAPGTCIMPYVGLSLRTEQNASTIFPVHCLKSMAYGQLRNDILDLDSGRE